MTLNKGRPEAPETHSNYLPRPDGARMDLIYIAWVESKGKEHTVMRRECIGWKTLKSDKYIME